MSTEPLERSVALAMALSMSFLTGAAAARRVNCSVLMALATGMPRTSAATTVIFRGAMRR